MALIPNFNKEAPRPSGGVWWFAVLGGALAIAYAVRSFVNGGLSSGSVVEVVSAIGAGILGIAAASYGLIKAFRSGLKEPEPPDKDLKIT